MDIDDWHKVSEIFSNFAQPIATLLVGLFGLKKFSDKKPKTNKQSTKKRKRR